MTRPADVTVLREIADGAVLAPDVRVGPFCTLGPHVVVGPRTVLGPRVTLTGHTTIGADNLIGPDSVLGAAPQDLKYHGKPTYLIVGDRNRLGAKVTAHVGTEVGGYITRIGHDNVLEAGAHVAHDCYVDDRTHLGAGVLLAGHIRVETGAVLEDMLGVTHFSTIGRYARCGARTPVQRDVPPFCYYTSGGYYGAPPAVAGVHEQGLTAAGLEEVEKLALRETIEHLFRDEQALAVKVRSLLGEPELPPSLRYLCEFCLRSLSGRFGRYREGFRGKIPPEARRHLPKELLAAQEESPE